MQRFGRAMVGPPRRPHVIALAPSVVKRMSSVQPLQELMAQLGILRVIRGFQGAGLPVAAPL